VGIQSVQGDQGIYFRSFEAHPRGLSIPHQLDLPAPWLAEGTKTVLHENFSGAQGLDLAGQGARAGTAYHWRQDMGRGRIELTGDDGVQVKASAKSPNPGRTVYTVAWEHSKFADLQVEITPPGSDRGQGEKGRGGLIFWQDAQNYIIVNNWLDDRFAGSSISSFFTINGLEDLYDAVWTNVGKRLRWGITHQLRVVFDGLNYMAFVNDEPVLYRSLRDVYPQVKRLEINRVGIVANWEWGNDTGSIFKNFLAKV
jgi:hypothetical protein